MHNSSGKQANLTMKIDTGQVDLWELKFIKDTKSFYENWWMNASRNLQRKQIFVPYTKSTPIILFVSSKNVHLIEFLRGNHFRKYEILLG